MAKRGTNRVAVRLRRASGVSKSAVCVQAERMLDELELIGAELSVVLTNDSFIAELNSRFAGEEHPTDVLAFACSEAPGPHEPGLLGDVVVSLETARRQAAQRGVALDDEVVVLLAHGILHLVGYDHRTRAELRIMKARELELVRAARVQEPRVRRPSVKAE